MDFNKPEAYCAQGWAVSIYREASISERKGDECRWSSLLDRDRRGQRSDSSHVELGGWRTWAERTQTLGVALLQWRWLRLASELLPLFFFLFSPSPSFFCTKFTEWFRPGRDALKVPRLVITLASRLFFKYRAFSYDLVDCVVKAEVVVAIARHFLSFFFLGGCFAPLDTRFLSVSKAPRPNERYLMLSRRSFLGDCSRWFRIFFKIRWQIGGIVFWDFSKEWGFIDERFLFFYFFLYWYLCSSTLIIIHIKTLMLKYKSRFFY